MNIKTDRSSLFLCKHAIADRGSGGLWALLARSYLPQAQLAKSLGSHWQIEGAYAGSTIGPRRFHILRKIHIRRRSSTSAACCSLIQSCPDRKPGPAPVVTIQGWPGRMGSRG